MLFQNPTQRLRHKVCRRLWLAVNALLAAALLSLGCAPAIWSYRPTDISLRVPITAPTRLSVRVDGAPSQAEADELAASIKKDLRTQNRNRKLWGRAPCAPLRRASPSMSSLTLLPTGDRLIDEDSDRDCADALEQDTVQALPTQVGAEPSLCAGTLVPPVSLRKQIAANRARKQLATHCPARYQTRAHVSGTGSCRVGVFLHIANRCLLDPRGTDFGRTITAPA